jgi:hypothetical protein
MTFDQAVARVLAARNPRVAAFAFVPTVRRGVTAGGALYVIAYDAEAPKGEDPIVVAFMAGVFASGEGEIDVFTTDDVPEEALDLDYTRTDMYDAGLAEYDIEIVLAVLRGATLAESLAAFDAVDRTQGPNATPEALTADLLIAHGFPALLDTPAGPLPAAVVLLDDQDPRLGVLVDAFGGIVVVDDEPPAPDAESESPPSPDDDDDADDADDDDDDDDETGEPAGEAAWVVVGRGAALATLLAVRALPEWEGDVPLDFADAWRAARDHTATLIANPADADGRRSKPAFQELRRLSTKIARLIGRQITDHALLMSTISSVVAAEIEKGTIPTEALVLPSVEELEAGVRLPEGLWS